MGLTLHKPSSESDLSWSDDGWVGQVADFGNALFVHSQV